MKFVLISQFKIGST